MHDRLATQDMPRTCRQCSARLGGICSVLDATQLAELALHTRSIQHEAGAELFGDETHISSYANIIHGVVKLFKILEDGRQQVVALKFSADFLGRIRGSDNRIGAQAASDIEVCHIPRKVLDHLLEENRALEKHMLDLALTELDEAREWMVTLGRKTASERVASFLYLVAAHLVPGLPSADLTFDLPLTRAEIGDFLGLSLETVSRQMSALRRDAVIAIHNNRRITIQDLPGLRQRCG